METELKLLISADDIEAIESLELLQRYGEGECKERRLVSTYYDTENLDLRAERISLRMRDKGDGWVRTVKTAGSHEVGLHRRNEFEVRLSQPELDLEAIGQLGIAALEQAIQTQQLSPQFVTDFVRKQWLLHNPDGDEVVEFALDQGAVRRCAAEINEEEIAILEIELELKSNAEDADPAFLFQLAEEIKGAGITTTPSAESKAARGYRLLNS